MKIILNYHEGRAVLSRAPDWMEENLREGRKHTWKKSHIYEMPAVGWRDLLTILFNTAYGPRGGKVSGDSLYTAIGKITSAVRSFELHPAFSDSAMLDGRPVIIPAFMYKKYRTPYPIEDNGHTFTVLMPRHQKHNDHTLVTWAPASEWELARLPEDPMCDEAVHAWFAAQGARETQHLRGP